MDIKLFALIVLGLLLAALVYTFIGAACLLWADEFVERDESDTRFANLLIMTWPLWMVVILSMAIWYRRWPQRR